MSTSLTVQPLKAEDMTAAAVIMREAFASSGDLIHFMLYPPSITASSGYTQEKRDSLAAKSFQKQHFDDAEAKGKVCMGVFDKNDGRLLGIAVWVKPGIPVQGKKEDKKEDDNEEKNLEMDYSVLERLIAELTLRRVNVMGDTPHWYLQYLLVAPSAQGRGVGSVLLKWGLEQADSANPTLPVVLEASPAGQPVYEKKGFEIQDWCRIAPSDENGNEIVEKGTRIPTMVRPAR